MKVFYFPTMIYYVYILESEADGSFYIGYSANPGIRLIKHNESRTGYTSRKQPWKIVYMEQFANKGEAIRRERFIKEQKSRDFIVRLIMSDHQRDR